MTDSEETTEVEKADLSESSSSKPLVFISHDGRDRDLASAFSKLIKSVSAGMIDTFHSSSKQGQEGIDFGEEWYKRLMEKLESTTHVICLFTQRSLERPWILFEAGVAKSKLGRPVVGVAIGVPLTRVGVGPFYQFQNMEDSEEDLARLLKQIAREVDGLHLDDDVVQDRIKAFKESESSILAKLGPNAEDGDSGESPSTTSVAKVLEEMKSLPSRVARRLAETGEVPIHRRRMRKFHPHMLEELMHITGEPNDPIGILMMAGFIRDDVPWMYELAMEAYRAAKSGDPNLMERELTRMRRFSETVAHGPWMEEFGVGDKHSHMFMMEFPRMLERHLIRVMESRREQQRHTPPPPPPPSYRPMSREDDES